MTAEKPVAQASLKVEAALQAEKTITFDGVLFEHDKATLRPSSDADIAAVADALKARLDLHVRFKGTPTTRAAARIINGFLSAALRQWLPRWWRAASRRQT